MSTVTQTKKVKSSIGKNSQTERISTTGQTFKNEKQPKQFTFPICPHGYGIGNTDLSIEWSKFPPKNLDDNGFYADFKLATFNDADGLLKNSFLRKKLEFGDRIVIKKNEVINIGDFVGYLLWHEDEEMNSHIGIFLGESDEGITISKGPNTTICKKAHGFKILYKVWGKIVIEKM